MTAQEVVWFFNHKYGEKAYVVETPTRIHIFTSKSKWQIIKDDYSRFHKYTLYHYSIRAGKGYHKQMTGREIDYLVFCACWHDKERVVFPRDFNSFQYLWEMYLYGRQIEERAARFAWICGEELGNSGSNV